MHLLKEMDFQREEAKTRCSEIEDVLKSIRKNILDYESPLIDPLQPFEQLMSLRSLLRSVALQLEAKRQLARNKKEQIEKGRTYLEGLEYFKSMLKTKVDICSVDVEDISEVFEQSLDLEWTDKWPQMSAQIKNWIVDSRQKRQLLTQVCTRKDTQQAQIKNNKSLYNETLQTHLKRLGGNLKDVVGAFNIEPIHLLAPIENKKLLAVYNYFQPLKESRQIEMDYADQTIGINIVLSANDKRCHAATDIKLPIDLKFNLIYLEDSVVIGVEGRSIYDNNSVFHRLINDEPSAPLYSNPKSQQQRNNSKRYLSFKWLDDITDPRRNLSITSGQLLHKIQDRLLAIQLKKHLIQGNFRNGNNKLGFYFRTVKQGENVAVHLKKFTVSTVSAVSFEQFKKLVFVPQWGKSLVSSQDDSNNGKSLLTWNELFNHLGLQEINNPRIYQHYKIIMNAHQYTLVFMLLIPYNYPQQKSIIKIIEITRKKEQKKYPTSLPDKIICSNFVNFGMSIANTIRAKSVQEEVNSSLQQFMSPENTHFYVFYQLNRLITLMEKAHLQDAQKECVVSKLINY